MTTIDQGMNVAEVEALGHKLQDTYAAGLQQIVADVERLVGSSADLWVGKDSSDFRSWWPSKRAKLTAMADDLRGYGQSALNNAKEQLGASGEGGASGATPPGPTPPGGSSAVPPTLLSSAGGFGVLPGANRSWQDVQAAYDAGYRKFGLWADGAPGGENQYQCVSWAWFRLRELGYHGPQVQANGLAVAGALGGTTTTVPHPGAVLSYHGSGDQFGHVMIAEEVTKNSSGHLQVRVSEMNTDSNPYVANPSEYKSTRVWTQLDNGQWTDGRSTREMTIANPNYQPV